MLKFTSPETTDRLWISDIMKEKQNRSMDYSFGIIYLWKDIFGVEIARYKDSLLARSAYEGTCGNCTSYLFPAAKTPEKEFELLEEVLSFIKENCGGKIPLIYGITSKRRAAIEEKHPGRFVFVEDRTTFEYIYNVEKLVNLSGKKLKNKRNALRQFEMENQSWTFEMIDHDNLPECIGMYREWYASEREFIDDEQALASGLGDEHHVMELAMIDFWALGYIGGLIRVNGRVVAFTFGEHLSDDTFILHVEKANTEYPGSYAIINRAFAANYLLDKYVYVNREDDVGDENLRQSKLSYNPEILLEKYHMFLSDDYEKADINE